MSQAKRLKAHAQRNKARLETGLLGVIPLLWPLLAAADRRSLRACCHATRQRVDWLLGELRFDAAAWKVDGSFAAAAAAVLPPAWRRVLARGARPTRLELHLPGLQAPACTDLGLRVLAVLGAASPPVLLSSVSLVGLPLTTAVVRAIAAAAPQLSALHLFGYDPSCCTGLRGSLPFSHGLGGVQGLLRHAAPHLRELAMLGVDTWAAAPWLPPLLQQCSRLTSLKLTWSVPSEPLLEALPALSHLTQLSINVTEAALPAVAQLRGLVQLDLLPCTLQPAGLQLLAGLGALTSLCANRVELPQQQPGSDYAAVPPRPCQLPLPPKLASLTLVDRIHPAALVALRLPDSLTELSLWEGIAVSRDDNDLYGHLRPETATALLTACGKLHGRTTSATLSLSWCEPPTSWSNRYSVLYDAVRQAAVRSLDLRHVTLTAADVAALVRQLPALEALFLTCHAPPHTWPLLGRLERLRVLRLCPGMGNSAAFWTEFGSEPALRAALISLCIEAPRLERLELALVSADNDDESTAAFAASARAHCTAAAKWLEGVLPRLRAVPPRIVCDARAGGLLVGRY